MKKQILAIALGALVTLLIGTAASAANISFEEKQAIVESRVSDGIVSEETAEGFLNELKSRIAECTCDGTCEGPDADRERLGQKYGIGGFGFGKSIGEGNGAMNGQRGPNGRGMSR